jgi:hypothetical protein
MGDKSPKSNAKAKRQKADRKRQADTRRATASVPTIPALVTPPRSLPNRTTKL